MATMIRLKNVHTGELKEVPIGFSWTTLFFGFFVPLFRGDIKWTIIIALVTIITAGFGVIPFAFFYNKIYVKELIAKGYIPADDASKNILQIRGITFDETMMEKKEND